MFPAADPLALDLLTKLLRFDPMQRISAVEALSHPYFDVLKTRDYINSYKAKNQHIFDDDVLLSQAAATSISPASRILQQKQKGELALRPDPMNVDIEKAGESPENLKRNVSSSAGGGVVVFEGVTYRLFVYRSFRRCSTIAAETRRCRLQLRPPLLQGRSRRQSRPSVAHKRPAKARCVSVSRLPGILRYQQPQVELIRYHDKSFRYVHRAVNMHRWGFFPCWSRIPCKRKSRRHEMISVQLIDFVSATVCGNVSKAQHHAVWQSTT